MRYFTRLLPGLLAALLLLAFSALPPSLSIGADSTSLKLDVPTPAIPTRDPFLLAIWTVESSGGKNCIPGNDGEQGCFQILPETAKLEGCREYDADCAARWLKRGQRTCRRWDEWAAARWYNRGRCMGVKTKPGAYEQQVIAEWLRWRMKMETI